MAIFSKYLIYEKKCQGTQTNTECGHTEAVIVVSGTDLPCGHIAECSDVGQVTRGSVADHDIFLQDK